MYSGVKPKFSTRYSSTLFLPAEGKPISEINMMVVLCASDSGLCACLRE